MMADEHGHTNNRTIDFTILKVKIFTITLNFIIMPKLNPYLNFDGKAEEAFNFINLFSEENSLVRFTKWEMHQVLKTYLKKLKTE